jgi:hypothetical protein
MSEVLSFWHDKRRMTMNILTLPRMVVSSETGWPELEKLHPTILKAFVFIVLPLSLIPPAMLYYAGTTYGDDFLVGYGSKPWGWIAGAFFLAEMLTFAGMGWFIKQFAENRKVKIDSHDAYLLAAIAPVPLWLSAFSLFSTNMAINAAISLIALACSCGLIYHGIFALCHMHEEIKAMSITYAVISAGLAAWVLLLLVVIAL